MLNNCVYWTRTLKLEVSVNNNYMCITKSDLHYSQYQPNQLICNSSACINFSFLSNSTYYIPRHDMGNIFYCQN